MNPLEQQLKRLCEVDGNWFFSTRGVAFGPEGQMMLWVKDGQLQGGEALWFMLSELQERWISLWRKDLRERLSETECKEKEILEREIDWMDLTAELILSTYIAWKEATL